MRVDIWSDVVCPWCYIGKRRFETALRRVGQYRTIDSIEVVYQPYQLDPTAPPGIVQPVVEAYARKFGGFERAQSIIDHVTALAAADGIEFHMDQALRANTLLAHRLLWFAADTGHQVELKERLLRAYFTEGDNISDHDVLVQCAVDAGLDAAATHAFLAGDDGHAEVIEQLAVAAAHGITAVPTYVFNGEWAVPGAQDPELFERILNRMLDQEDTAGLSTAEPSTAGAGPNGGSAIDE